MRFGKRLREPSTWASLAALAAIISPKAAEIVGAVGPAVVAVAGAVAAVVGIVTPERTAQDQQAEQNNAFSR